MTLPVCQVFESFLKEHPSQSPSIAAITALVELLRHDNSTTLQELIAKMRDARNELNKTDFSVVSVSSGCELFMRFITLSEREIEQASDFSCVRKILLDRGEKFLNSMKACRKKIIFHCSALIKEGMRILTHSSSQNVLTALIDAHRQEQLFHVFVLESQPDCSGKQMAKELEAVGISCTVIIDAAVSFYIDKIDAVLLGAEGVCENGGIINKIGTCTVATLAHLKKKPVYVLVESFKFLRTIPLSNSALPKSYLYKSSVIASGKDLSKEYPRVDYTHPENLTLLYTDLGVLPTSAVTEHLIKLYT